MQSEFTGAGGGGPAASGGFNFQAAVTAIALAHALRAAPLGWLDGLVADAPVSVAAETGSGGDDLRLTFEDGTIAEAQIKRGLRAGEDLWSALSDIAEALASGEAQYGLLLVSSSSSGTIRDGLAADLVRLGQGAALAADGLGAQFADRLEARRWNVAAICARLRIVTISAMSADGGDVRAARAHLSTAFIRPEDGASAWDRLYRDAHEMQAGRGRRTRATILQVLRSTGLALRAEPAGGPSQVLEHLCRWTAEMHAEFLILGVERPLSMDRAYIQLTPYVRSEDENEHQDKDLPTALSRYHDWDRRLPARDAPTSDAHALGRFYRRAVVVAGPGTGKSTLLSKLARTYAKDGFPVLMASALAVARRMSSLGQGFEEALFALALDGSGVAAATAQAAGVADWVVLLDGLDEAGTDQATLAGGLRAFVQGRPHVRVVVTTRPVGYQRAAFAGWRHYDLPSISDGDVDRTLADLLTHVLPATDPRLPRLRTLVEAATSRSGAGKAALRTPLMIGLAAALFASGGPIMGSRPAFYRAAFQLMEDMPRAPAVPPAVTKATRNRFLDLLGWYLTCDPRLSANAALDLCARALASELELSTLTAQQLTDQCRDFWERSGVIEQLRHAGDHAIAFVHKSFGEFAAGRYLASGALELQRRTAAESLEHPAWREPVAFAAALGAAPVILDSLSDQGFGEGEGENRLLTALDILIDAAPPEPLAVAEPILRVAFRAARDDRRNVVGRLGVKLMTLAATYPDLTSTLADPLLEHAQAWTRLVGVASSFGAAPASRQARAWIEAFIDVSGGGASGLESRMRGLQMHDAHRDLIQEFAARLAEKVMDDLPVDEAQEVLGRHFVEGPLDTMGFIIRMERLIQHRSIRPWWRMDLSGLAHAFSAPDVIGAMRRTFGTLMRGLVDDGLECQDQGGDSDALYTVAGFLELVKFKETSLPELWPVARFGADEDVRWVWRSVARLASLPLDALAREATGLAAAIERSEAEALSVIFARTPNVDLPAPNWTAAPTLPIDPDLVERALRRPSAIVVNSALHIAASGSEDLLRRLARRLLSDGVDLTLAAAAQLAGELPRAEALDLLFSHAAAPRSGSEYVFEQLHRLQAGQDGRRMTALRAGLLGTGPRVAEAAAAWAAANPVSADLPIVEEAFELWRRIEAPYPDNGGVIPPSPRAKLLQSILALSAPSWRTLLLHCEDSRLDVRAVARIGLSQAIREREHDRDEIAEAVATSALPVSLVQTVAEEADAFSPSQLRRMLASLSSDDGDRRFALLGLLGSPALNPADRRARLDELRRDPRNEVRERAAHLLQSICLENPI